MKVAALLAIVFSGVLGGLKAGADVPDIRSTSITDSEWPMLVDAMGLSPAFEVGAATALSSKDDQLRYVIAVKYNGYRGFDRGAGVAYYVARVSTEVGFHDVSEFSHGLPTMRIDFTPIGAEGIADDLGTAELQVAPMTGEREKELNRLGVFDVKLAQFKRDFILPTGGDTAFIGTVIADAFGYKLINYAHSQGDKDFSGLRIGGIGLEAAEMFTVTPSFIVKVALGVYADLAKGQSNGPAYQSDTKGYLSVRVKLSQFFELYVEGALKRYADSGLNDRECAREFLGGAVFTMPN